MEPLAATHCMAFAQSLRVYDGHIVCEEVFEDLARAQKFFDVVGECAAKAGHNVEAVTCVRLDLVAFPFEVVKFENFYEDVLLEQVKFFHGEIL